MEKELKRLIKDYAFLLSISGAVVLLDQISKNLVRSNLHFGEIWPQNHWIVNYARIVHWSNTGAAFGMLQNFGVVFAVLAVVVSIAILIYFPRVPHDDWMLRLALSLQLGGAIGNLIDRLTIGHVTDFISLDSFAVFNVADASISIGTALLAVSLIQRERKEKTAKSQPEEDKNPDSNKLTPSPPFEEIKGE